MTTHPHPFLPAKAIVLHTTNDAEAISLIRAFKPAWLDEMPLAASGRAKGKSSIAQDGHYDEGLRRGMLAFYFGAGCDPAAAGWEVLAVHGVTEHEFNLVALPHSMAIISRVQQRR